LFSAQERRKKEKKARKEAGVGAGCEPLVALVGATAIHYERLTGVRSPLLLCSLLLELVSRPEERKRRREQGKKQEGLAQGVGLLSLRSAQLLST
jgi:hypothetical protein